MLKKLLILQPSFNAFFIVIMSFSCRHAPGSQPRSRIAVMLLDRIMPFSRRHAPGSSAVTLQDRRHAPGSLSCSRISIMTFFRHHAPRSQSRHSPAFMLPDRSHAILPDRSHAILLPPRSQIAVTPFSQIAVTPFSCRHAPGSQSRSWIASCHSPADTLPDLPPSHSRIAVTLPDRSHTPGSHHAILPPTRSRISRRHTPGSLSRSQIAVTPFSRRHAPRSQSCHSPAITRQDRRHAILPPSHSRIAVTLHDRHHSRIAGRHAPGSPSRFPIDVRLLTAVIFFGEYLRSSLHLCFI